MSIDPIALSKTGSIEQSTYTSAASTATSSKASETSASAASTAATTASASGTAASSTISSSAFIVDDSLAALIENGSTGLSGASLATYNSQALLTQNTGSLIANLATGGDSMTSEIVGSSSSWSLYRTMQSAAANAGTSLGEAEDPVQTTLSGSSTETPDSAPSSNSTGGILDSILKTSQTLYGDGDTATTAAQDEAETAATEEPDPETTTAASETTTSRGDAVLADVLKTSQTLYGSTETTSTSQGSTAEPSETATTGDSILADILETSRALYGSGG